MNFCHGNSPDEKWIDGVKYYKHLGGNELVPEYWYYSRLTDNQEFGLCAGFWFSVLIIIFLLS